MKELEYQVKMWELQKGIFDCPCLSSKNTESCYRDLANEVKNKKLGPDSVFVGKNYGKNPQIPRILFVGNNPNSGSADFGTLASVLHTSKNNLANFDSATFFKYYYEGTNKYYGIKKFSLYNNPEWSISRILNELFGDTTSSEAFSYTNSVLCKGMGAAGSPSQLMRMNCIKEMGWLRQTLEILEPEIIFLFSIGESNSAWSSFTIENGVVDKEIYLEPESSNAYKVQYKIKSGMKTQIALVFGIPHLTTPKFSTWTNRKNQPKIFRDLMDTLPSSKLTPENIIAHLLDDIKGIVKNQLDLAK